MARPSRYAVDLKEPPKVRLITEEWTMIGKPIGSQLILGIGVLSPLLVTGHLWWQGQLVETVYLPVLLFVSLMVFWLVYRLTRGHHRMSLTVSGHQLTLTTPSGQEVFDIVKDRVFFRHVVTTGRFGGHSQELICWKQWPSRPEITLEGFSNQDLRRLEDHIGSLHYNPKADKVFPVFDRLKAVREVFGYTLNLLMLPTILAIITLVWGRPEEIAFLYKWGGVMLSILILKALWDWRHIPQSLVFQDKQLVVNGQAIDLAALKRVKLSGITPQKDSYVWLTLILQDGKVCPYYLGCKGLKTASDQWPMSELLVTYFKPYYYEGELADLTVVYGRS